jgi:hypothetical protein
MLERGPKGDKRATEHRRPKPRPESGNLDIGSLEIDQFTPGVSVVIPGGRPEAESGSEGTAAKTVYISRANLPEFHDHFKLQNRLTPKQVHEKYFSVKARRGYIIAATDGAVALHIKGWYERFPNLSHEEINKILRAFTKVAKVAKLTNYLEPLIEGALAEANVQVKRKHKK